MKKNKPAPLRPMDSARAVDTLRGAAPTPPAAPAVIPATMPDLHFESALYALLHQERMQSAFWRDRYYAEQGKFRTYRQTGKFRHVARQLIEKGKQ
jgi:hypothetical protein